MKAVWNGAVIAESNDTLIVEGYHYFPANSVSPALLRDSSTTTFCPWKGIAHYKTLVVGGVENPDACWYYRRPWQAKIKDRVAFWRGVAVTR